jgi:prepilin-type N-terminal cleavage/methylation domain-containing protein
MLRRIREAKNNESGFTLIELLIVIVILGILAAIVVFAVGAFNKNGQQAACKADFKSVEIADDAYFAKNGSYATIPGNLVPDYLNQWPQATVSSDGTTLTPVQNAPYSIVIGTATTGPSAQVGSTISTDASACASLS